jgi:hypothetical protein
MSFVAIDKDHVEALKRSMEIVGQLQPVLVEKGTNGKKVLVGKHRAACPNCKDYREIEVKDDLHRELIILHGNVQRGIPEEEAKYRVMRIAQILEARGVPKNRICQEMLPLVPWSQRHLERLLPKEYKMQTVPQKSRHVSTFTPSMEVAHDLASKIRTALDEIKTVDDKPVYPRKDCLCPNCPGRVECYGQ